MSEMRCVHMCFRVTRHIRRTHVAWNCRNLAKRVSVRHHDSLAYSRIARMTARTGVRTARGPSRRTRRRHAQARAASTSTAETAGAAAAGDVGAAGDASAVAELDNPSARTHASAPDDVRGATLGKRASARARALPRPRRRGAPAPPPHPMPAPLGTRPPSLNWVFPRCAQTRARAGIVG